MTKPKVPGQQQKRGPKPGRRRGGRPKGAKNKATIEREEKARLAAVNQIKKEQRQRDRRFDKAGVITLEDAKDLLEESPERLMKDIAFDVSRLFAAMMDLYRPWLHWKRDPNGKLTNANPDYDEAKFKEWAMLAAQASIAAAPYQSPKLSAVMIGADVLNTIEIVGGLPDDQDGGLLPAESPETIGEDGQAAAPAPPDLKVIGE